MSALALAAALCSSGVIAAYDVVVVGAGPAGIGAALAAARAGAKTALVERDSSVGGTTVQADVTEIGLFHAWRRQIIAGPAWDLVTNAVAALAAERGCDPREVPLAEAKSRLAAIGHIVPRSHAVSACVAPLPFTPETRWRKEAGLP